jgi:hypothetical protein
VFMTNFRGVCLASVLLKLYERLLKDRKDVWSRVMRPVSYLQDEANPGHDCRMQLMLAREILAYRLLGLGKKNWVLQIDIRRAFPSTIRAYALLAMRRSGLGGAWLAAFWRLQESAGVKLSTAYGLYSEAVKFARGLLEGRVLSGDAFAFVLDELRRVLEESGLGVRLHVPGGASLYVGAVMKTGDVLLLGESEEQVRLAYGVVLAWCYEMRLEHAPKKAKLMLTGPEGAICAQIETFVPQEETLVYQPFF